MFTKAVNYKPQNYDLFLGYFLIFCQTSHLLEQSKHTVLVLLKSRMFGGRSMTDKLTDVLECKGRILQF